MRRDTFDAAVIGGGPAGSAAARLLAEAGRRVLLVDQSTPGEFKVGESLVPAARTLLADLGALDRFLAAGHRPCYGHASAWGSDRVHGVDFIHSPFGHGWHLDRARFDELLRGLAIEAGAVPRLGARLAGFARSPAGLWTLELEGPAGDEEIDCGWLLDCTGRSHKVAAGLGVPCRYEDHLIAFYARFRAEKRRRDEEALSFVESAPEGWWYTARLPSDDRMVIFFTEADLPWAKPARQGAGFLALLEQTSHLKDRLRRFGYAMLEKPRGADARSARLDRFHGDGWLAAGDAATAFDPLSSQGIFTALYSGLKVARALLDWGSGDGLALTRYDEALSAVYERFLINRRSYYQSERRWPDSAFWRSRLAAEMQPSPAGG